MSNHAMSGASPELLPPHVLISPEGEIQFFAIPSNMVRASWSLIEPLLARFHDETAIASQEDVALELMQARAQLWAGWDGIRMRGLVVTQIHVTSFGHFCNVWVAISDLQSTAIIKQALEILEQWAKSIGCYAVKVVGREGFARTLPGYERVGYIFGKRLHEVH